MSKDVNTVDAKVVEEVSEVTKNGIVSIDLFKGEKPENDMLEATLYYKEGNEVSSPIEILTDLDLRKITDKSIDKFLDNGMTTSNIKVFYSHAVVSELLSQEFRNYTINIVESMKSMKTEYESMESNGLIELSEDQKSLITAGCKVIDKMIDKFSIKE